MDTTKEYILMCEKAEEIQKLAPSWPEEHYPSPYKEVQEGSFFWDIVTDEIQVLHWDNDEGEYIIGGYGERSNLKIWLPRQDQLQEMIDWIPKNNPSMLIMGINSFDLNKYAAKFTSMEQLWLAFVMQEKYGKTWNGKEWKND